MLMASGWFLCLLTILQVSARYKNVELDFIKDDIESEFSAVSSLSPRIVSGWEAQPGQHPHHAALRFVDAAGNLRVCGGSIVSKDWVITSARCTVSGILAIVRAGGIFLTNPEYVFESTEWYNHPGFNNLSTSVQQHSISLLKLQRPVVYTRLVKAIRVQSSADAYRNYAGELVYASGHGRTETGLVKAIRVQSSADALLKYDGEQVNASGHGRTVTGIISDELRWVYLQVISNAVCSTASSNVYDTTICALYFNVTSQPICADDVGGPLVHVGNDGIPTLIGVSHFFPNIACDIARPTGFMRPGAYLPWFKAVTGIDFENLQEDDGNVDKTTTTTTDSTTTNTTDSENQVPDENTSAPPQDSEENEDDSESNEVDKVQLLKRLEVNVKVKVAFNKNNVTHVGKEIV